MLTAQIINREGVAQAPPRGEPNDNHDEVGLSPIAEQMRAWRKLCAEREFQSPDWSLGNTLSWLAFHDPALICQLKRRLSVLWYGIYKHPKRGASFAVRPMLVPRADQTLLDALMDGQLTAIRNGIEIPSSYWFGKHVKHLSDDLRFRRMEVLAAFPAQSAASTPPQAERIANMPLIAGAVQSAAKAALHKTIAARLPRTVPWDRFCDDVRADCGVTKTTRGCGDRTINRIAKRIIKDK